MTSPESTHCPHCFAAPAETPCPVCGWQPHLNNPPPALALGTLLDGRYRIGRVLGHGGFGITYLAWDDNLHLRLAIKEYFPRDSAGRGADGVSLAIYSGPAREQFAYGLDRFLEEARTLAHFDQHPGIVTVKNFFRAHGTGYCVMDYVEGITLRQYLDQQPGGRISVADALQLLTPVMDALRAVHKDGLLHRDLAPDNIYLTQDGRIKLLDFGAARFAASEHSKSLSIILKPGYAPEEQYRTRGAQGPWTDVYGLAATFYRAITGQVPPESLDRLDNDDLVSPSRLGVAIKAEQEATLLRALAVKAGQRFQGMAEMQAAWRDGGGAAPMGGQGGSVPPAAAVVSNTKSVTRPSDQRGAVKPVASDMPPINKPNTGRKLIELAGLIILSIVGYQGIQQYAAPRPALATYTPAPSPSLAPTGAPAPSDRAGANPPSPPGAAPATAGGNNAPTARYRFLGKNQDIVEDTRTQLQWQRCSLGQTWTGVTCTGEAKKYKWDEARRAAPTGWRLPTKDELASLVYCSSGEPAYWKTASGEWCKGAYTSPTISITAFPNTPIFGFWSSSPVADYARFVNFILGDVGLYDRNDGLLVRLVRGGQ